MTAVSTGLPAPPATSPAPATAAEPTTAPSNDGGPSDADVRELGASISSLMRSFHRAKAQFVAETEHDVAWSAHIVLARLATEGPLRAGELAELIQSDPSTVSRQVASIVRAGLVQRQADPEDGRASLLMLTEAGREVYRQQLEVRTRHMALMLQHWSEQDCRQLAHLLARLTDDFERYRPTMFNAAQQALTPGGEI
jgi:DNA-binding MarR family transcriptional regulator